MERSTKNPLSQFAWSCSGNLVSSRWKRLNSPDVGDIPDPERRKCLGDSHGVTDSVGVG